MRRPPLRLRLLRRQSDAQQGLHALLLGAWRRDLQHGRAGVSALDMSLADLLEWGPGAILQGQAT